MCKNVNAALRRFDDTGEILKSMVTVRQYLGDVTGGGISLSTRRGS